jgi:type I restriction enzyme S subunit
VSEVVEQTAASWPEVVISDVSELIRGVTYSKEHATDKRQDGYTPVLRATNIQESRLVLESDLVFVPDSNVSANQRLRVGDIVVATSSGSKHLVGKSGLVHADWRGSFGAFCAAIRPKANIESRYLAAFLQSPSYWKQVGKKALGVNINNLRRGDIESLTLPLPPLAKQREIVAELEKQFSRLDEAVANLQRVKTNLKRYKASILKSAVEGRLVETEATLARREGRTYETGEQLLQRILAQRRAKWVDRGKYKEPVKADAAGMGVVPEGWTTASLDMLSTDSGYGTSQKCRYENDGPVVLRIPNVQHGILDLHDLKFAPTEFKLSQSDAVSSGDMLIIRTNGSKSLIGRAAVVMADPHRIMSFASYLIRFRLSNVDCIPAWVSIVWQTSQMREWIEAHAATSAGQHNVSMTVLAKAAIPVPPVAEQARIVAEVDRHLSIIREVEAEVDSNLQRAKALRQAALAKAFEVRS